MLIFIDTEIPQAVLILWFKNFRGQAGPIMSERLPPYLVTELILGDMAYLC
jgi:hypothetical protein